MPSARKRSPGPAAAGFCFAFGGFAGEAVALPRHGAWLGWLNAPARVLQAVAPLVFGTALAAWGLNAIWLTAGVGLLATAALLILRR